MKKIDMTFVILLVTLLSSINLVQAQTCTADIIYDNGSWTGGSGPGGAPDNSVTDLAKGIHIKEDVNLTSTVNCNCLTVDFGTTLSVNDGNSLTVTNNIILNGDIRVLGNSQLIQTHTGTSQVTGSGKLYIDQTFSAINEYRFNYVSAPVVKVGSSTFSFTECIKDGSTPLNETNTPGDIVYTGASNGEKTSPITISNDWFYTYINSNAWTRNWTLPITIPSGFTFKGPGGGAQNYTFVGTPNDGEYTTPISPLNLSLIGNPYPCALDADKFIDDNDAVMFGTLYFWDQKGDGGTHNQEDMIAGYATRNKGAGITGSEVEGTAGLGDGSYEAPSRYIAMGQSFFVRGLSNGDITFNNSQRLFETVGGANYFFRKANQKEDIPTIKLGFQYTLPDSEKVISSQVAVTFIKGNSFSFENGYDSISFGTIKNGLYFKFPGDAFKYIIAGVQEFDDTIEIPLGVVVEKAGTYKFDIDELINFSHDKIYLYDSELNQQFSLSSSKASSIELDAGTFENRFFLIFKEKPGTNLSVDKQALLNDSVKVYYNTAERVVNVFSKNNLINNIEVYYNLGGSSTSITNEDYSDSISINLGKNHSGLCVLKIQTENGIIFKKLIL